MRNRSTTLIVVKVGIAHLILHRTEDGEMEALLDHPKIGVTGLDDFVETHREKLDELFQSAQRKLDSVGLEVCEYELS